MAVLHWGSWAGGTLTVGIQNYQQCDLVQNNITDFVEQNKKDQSDTQICNESYQ